MAQESSTESVVSFARKELAGSRLACLGLTSGAPARIAGRLTGLTDGRALVGPSDLLMPRGLLEPNEAELGRTQYFLTADLREQLMSWWLAVKVGARVPSWDIAATCTIDERKGLLLVEAKAHDQEPDASGKREGNPENHERIAAAIAAANDGLNAVVPGWNLSRDRCYQLSNRFAWGWKLATLGVPVVLVFLGIIGADEMATGGRRSFQTSDEWRRLLLDHSERVVPARVWGTHIDVNGTPLFPVIRSVRQEFTIE